MLHVLKNEKKFTLLFFVILTIDILVKLKCPEFPYRFISKPPIVLSLFIYYYLNNTEIDKEKKKFVFWGLLSFLIGTILIINDTNMFYFGASLLFFSLAKLFLSLKFSHKSDFEVSKLIPFSIIIFIYTVWMVCFLYDSLGGFFIPALLSFFLSLLLFQFAFIRSSLVDKCSYVYVLVGVILYLFSESMMVIKIFKTDLPLQDPLIMIFYSVAMYLITIGLVKEKKIKRMDFYS
ncbi:lysoplasmalogenase family protein [Mariniflexile ostreae]|uniref:Lysoplasmalogenase family protein n=1 Tax=Mariniflexile ostreae TaxID=1520892 RepID=A0ABV5F8J4_9FLAO